MNPYFPILPVLAIALIVGSVLSALAHFLGPRKPNKVKGEVFECGVPSVGGPRDRMSVRYYLTAIIFILFDIETVFLYLWAKVFRTLGWFGMAEILVFVGILLVGYVYVLKSGALEWD